MNERLNRTSICTVVFLDIVEYSKWTDAEQISKKDKFNRLINAAIEDISQNDRILLDTGDGAAIALLGAPEEALFVALNIRDGILALNAGDTISVRIGINLGPVRVVKDINGRPNIIGDGINVAQRVMSFAEPNQILVSRSYFEITSRLSREITELFIYSGIKHDKHVREHEVYSIGASHQAGAAALSQVRQSVMPEQDQTGILEATKKGWWIGLVLIALVAGFTSLMFISRETPETMGNETEIPAILVESPKPEAAQVDSVQVELSLQEEPGQAKLEQVKSTEAEQKQTAQIAQESTQSPASTSRVTANSVWNSFKKSIQQGNKQETACTNAERSLNQCP